MGKGEFKVEAALAADADVPGPTVSTHEPEDAGASRALPSDTAERLGVPGAGAELVVLGPDEKPRERIAITRAPVTIGRLSTNDVVLADPNVSRRHAELRHEPSGWVLADLGSTNGTLVNGKLAKEHALADGDRIAFGTSELIFTATAKA
jgi:pSer/pThr/pTyr-binding forkhead associated (FHA) protein